MIGPTGQLSAQFTGSSSQLAAAQKRAGEIKATTQQLAADLSTLSNPKASPGDQNEAQQRVNQTKQLGNEAITEFKRYPVVANAVGEQAFQVNDLDRASWASDIAAQNARNNLANPEDANDAKENRGELLKALTVHSAVAEKKRDWPTAKADTDEIINLHPDDPKLLEAAQAINAMARSHIGRVDPGLKKDAFEHPWTSGAAGAGTAGGPAQTGGAAAGAAITIANPQQAAQVKRLLEDATARLGLKDPEGALKATDEASRVDEKNAQARLLAAIALLSLNRLQQALETVDKAIALKNAQGPAANEAAADKAWLASAFTTRGRTEEALGDTGSARGDYLHASELDPQGQAQAATAFLQRLDAERGGAAAAATAPAAELARRSAARRGRAGALALLAVLLLASAAAWAARRKQRAFWGETADAAGAPASGAPLVDDTPATGAGLKPGLSLGHYELRKRLGVGGMGEVWEAYDHSLNRLVAIKKLASTVAGSPDALDGLIAEALNVARLKHPNVVAIHFVFRGQRTGDVYLVFEHVSEGTAADALAAGPLPPESAARIVRGAAAALDYAHAQGVIHRDLKPSNILLERGEAKVGDFGIARPTSHAEGTLTATASGTPAYMAPEQSLGVVSRGVDLYALGVTAYQLLTGQLPFPASRPDLKAAGTFTAASTLAPALPREVDAFFARALDPDPKKRFASGAELADGLERALGSPTTV